MTLTIDNISMEDMIVLYASEEHLNTMLPLSKFITKQHFSIRVTIISTADPSFATSISDVQSITYHKLPTVIPPSNLTKNPIELFFEIPRLYNPNLREALTEISKKSKIRAFVIDFFCNSAFEVSRSLNIPTYFHVCTGGFGVCLFLHFPTIHETVNRDIGEDLNEVHEAPGCPLLLSSDLPKALWFRESNSYTHFLSTAQNMRKASGILCNGFDALEMRAKEALSNGLSVLNGSTPPVFFIGPEIPGNNNINGSKKHECLIWLNSQPRKSVVFLCFGRRGLFSAKQLKEIAIGLERSSHRFLWSIRNPPEICSTADPDLDELLPEGFSERVKDRGFIIKSWAPQKEILSHKSVGGFVTHCGRSSVLEALINGVPMIGWPIYAEQRMHRVFMVEEMKVALQLGETEEGFVMADELEKRVREMMDSFKGRELRKRVEELRVATEVAVEKGGSSVVALGKFIDSLKTN